MNVQQAAELRSLNKDTKLQVCANAGVQHKTSVSRQLSLALKTNLGLSWNKVRAHKRFMKSVGVSFESEKAARNQQEAVIQDHLHGEMVSMNVKKEKDPHAKKGFVTEARPMVYVSDLTSYVTSRLNAYEKCNKLVWSDNNIPTEEVTTVMNIICLKITYNQYFCTEMSYHWYFINNQHQEYIIDKYA